MVTKDEAIQAGGRVLAQARADQATRTPRQAAEAAHVPGGPLIDELERRIRVRRGMPVERATGRPHVATTYASSGITRDETLSGRERARQRAVSADRGRGWGVPPGPRGAPPRWS